MPHSVTILGGNEDKPFESYIVNVDLFLSTNHSYVDIDMNKIREENNLNDIENNCDGIASEAMRISKLLELKYQKKSKIKGIHLSKADLKKKDYGYVPEDDFIDDEEDFDELIPFHLDTALGGCYINEGPSELKAVIEIDAEEAMLEEDYSDEDKSDDELVTLDKQSITDKPVSESSADEVHIEEEESNVKKRRAPTPSSDVVKKTKYTGPEIVSTENTTQATVKTTPPSTNMNGHLMETLNNLLLLVKERTDPSKKFRVNDEIMSLFDEIIKSCEKENFKNRDINKMYQYVAEAMNIHSNSLKEKLKAFRTNGTIGHQALSNGNSDTHDTPKPTNNGTQDKVRTEQQPKATVGQDTPSSSYRLEPADNLINHIKSLVSDEIEKKVRAEVNASIKASDNKRDNLIWSSVLNNYMQQFLKLFIESIANEPSITAGMVVDTFKRAINDILYPYFSECGNSQLDFQNKMKSHIETYHSEINNIVNKKQQNGIANSSGKQSPATNLPKQQKKDQPKAVTTEQTASNTKSSKVVVDKNKLADFERQIKTLIVSGNLSQLDIAEAMLNDNHLQDYIPKETILGLRSLLQARKQALKQNISGGKNVSSVPQKTSSIQANSNASSNGTTKNSTRVSNNTNNVSASSNKQSSLNMTQNAISQTLKQAVNQQLMQQQQNVISSIVTLLSQNQNRIPQNLMQLRNSGLTEAQISAFMSGPNQQFFAELVKQAARNRQ
uniref:HUN domain-containing protein n=1 Tax=Strongyloides papillosus TaxID=174720 RepID=A0A0N5BPQ9_STREA